MSKTVTISTAPDPETGEIQVKTITPFFRSPYNYDTDAVSRETGTACPEETLTQQQFKEECDINTILDRFGITGEVPTNVRQPISADFIEATDYQTAMNAMIEAQNAFMQMPAKIRARFENDPAKFINFFEAEENRAEAERLGLIMPAPEPAKTPEAPPKGDS